MDLLVLVWKISGMLLRLVRSVPLGLFVGCCWSYKLNSFYFRDLFYCEECKITVGLPHGFVYLLSFLEHDLTWNDSL
jgi:hypothetical protein